MFWKFSFSVALLVVFSTSSPKLVYAQTDKYFYAIFYDGKSCQTSTVALIRGVTGEEEIISGGVDNHTARCSIETTCLMDKHSQVCQAETTPTVDAYVRFDVDSHGRIFHCDDSNDIDQGICRYIELCYASSLALHCNVLPATTTDIVNNPNILLNENAFEDDGLDFSNYMLLYSDENCTMIEGAHGLVAGETAIPVAADTMSCQEAVACALHPEGELCDEYGGVTAETLTMHTKAAASQAVVCFDASEESCEEIDPLVCIRSEAFPSCWYRLATGKTLFSNPGEYFIRINSSTVNETESDEPLVEDEGSDASARATFWHQVFTVFWVGMFV